MTHNIAVVWHTPAIAVVSFCDEARQNQICWAAIDELGETLTECTQRGARVLILASALEGHWMEHAWLQDLSDGVDRKKQTGSGAGWFTSLEALTNENVVSIAAISGDCAGGGAELGWACDLRVAEIQARFSQLEVNIGLTTGIGGSCRLARLAGRSIAAEMVLTGMAMSASRLHETGAINRVVGKSEALAAALEMATDLVAKSPEALRGLKNILAVNDNVPLDQALENEQTTFQAVVKSDEARAAMKAVQQQYNRGHSIAEVNNYEKWRDK
ncbi:MAG: enoyl-CoA hydratase/isomerase family protein [Halioglobus sp.]